MKTKPSRNKVDTFSTPLISINQSNDIKKNVAKQKKSQVDANSLYDFLNLYLDPKTSAKKKKQQFNKADIKKGTLNEFKKKKSAKAINNNSKYPFSF